MKIKKLDIYGYGKWINQQFDLEEDIQIFYGQNEAGKSTLQSFIKSILFGFPRRNVKQNRYEPKKGDAFGGRILITETDYGNLWIERTEKKLTITSEEGDILENSILDTLLGGLNEQLFDNFYAFTLDNLQSLSGIGSEELNDYFLNISALGSDQLLRIAADLQKETEEMYRPSATVRPLNVMLLEYEELAKQRLEASKQQDRYNDLIQAENKEKELISDYLIQIQKNEEKLTQINQFIERYDIFLKNKAVDRELAELIETDIPDDAQNKLSYHQKMIHQYQQEQIKTRERIKILENELSKLTRLNWAENHEEERHQWITQTAKIKEIQSEIEQYERLIKETQSQIYQLATRHQFDPKKISSLSEFEHQLEQGLILQTDKISKEKEAEDIQVQQNVFLKQRQEQQQYIATVRQHIATLENQRINEEELLIQQTSLKDYLLPFIVSLLGIIVMIIYFTNKSHIVYMWTGLVFFFIAVGSSFSVFNRHQKLMRTYKESPIVDKIKSLKEDEERFKSNSQSLGQEINIRDEKLVNIQADIDTTLHELRRWLISIGFSPQSDVELLLKTNPIKEYYAILDKQKEFERTLTQQQTIVDEWRETLEPLLARFPTDELNVRSLIRYHEELEAELSSQVQKANQIREKIKQYDEIINDRQKDINDYQTAITDLFNQTDSANEHEFIQKVKVNARIDELRKSKVLYEEQLQEHKETLSTIESKQTLIDKLQATQNKLTSLKNKIEPHRQERAHLMNEIQRLEKDGTYQEINQLVENKRAEIKQALIEWGSKRMAMEIIHKTLRQGLDNPIPTMNEIATDIFKTLSFERYTNIRFNRKSIRVLQHSGLLFAPHELSQGTLEQLYVAIRLSFILSAHNLVKMPIIIDDAFVNFDSYRKESMYRVLNQVKEDIQILFFTFDDQVKDQFSASKIINLDS